MHKFALPFLMVAALGLTSCVSEQSDSASLDSKYTSHVAYVISVADLQATSDGGRALIDLWMPDYGYSVESGMDYSEIDVICPSGRFMTLEQFADELGVSSGEELFIYSSGAAEFQQEKNVPPCFDPCILEKEQDGTWACVC